MFKVQISGRLDGKPRLKRVANRDVCNFTIRCRNEHDKCDSYVRCAIWGKKASRFFYEVNEEKEIFIEGSGLNKKLRNVNGLNNYVLTVNCENYQILT